MIVTIAPGLLSRRVNGGILSPRFFLRNIHVGAGLCRSVIRAPYLPNSHQDLYRRNSGGRISICHAPERQNLSAGTQGIEIVRPRLHHFSPFAQPSCAVVCCADLIALAMCQLQLDQVWMPALLIQASGRHRSEAMRHHSVSGVAETSQGCVQGVVADRALVRAQ